MNKIYIGIETGTISIGIKKLLAPLQNIAAKENYQLVETGGFGLYAYEPMIEIEHNNERHAFINLSEKDLSNLILEGQPNFNHIQYAGKTKELPFIKCQTRFTFKRVGLNHPTCIESYQQQEGFSAIRKALSMEPQAIVDEIKESGLRGRGGAGFPTGIKLQTVKDSPAAQKYIVCNADEGDSGTFADRMLIEGDPLCLIEGMMIAGRAVGATQGFIYLRSEYPLAMERMNKAIENAYASGFLGKNILASGFDFELTIHKGAGAYICGEETSLLESLEGKRGVIRFKPPLPAIEGLFASPTALNNVITLATLPEIILQGGQAYSHLGYEKSKGTLTVQLAGNIKNGGLYEVPFGTSLKTLLTDIGDGTRTGRPIKAVQVGGPLGAYFPESLFDLPLDYETFAGKGGMVGHGGIVVFDDTTDLSEQAKFAFEFCAHESCGKCTPCRIGSTRGAELIERIQKKEDLEKNLTVVDDLCELMEETSLCALGGMTPYPVKSAIKHFPQDFGVK